jgi:hypothetical protein
MEGERRRGKGLTWAGREGRSKGEKKKKKGGREREPIHAPNKFFAIKIFMGLPIRINLRPQIEHDQLFVWNRVQKRLCLGRLPPPGGAVQKPTLEDPDGLGVGPGHSGEDGLAHGGEVGGGGGRREHFVEGVGVVEMVGSENFGLFLDEEVTNGVEEGVFGRKEVSVSKLWCPVEFGDRGVRK